jgi:hypothetical protein
MLAVSTSASAALVGRLETSPGSGVYQAYYDTVLNITWLANANLAGTNTFGVNDIAPDGRIIHWTTAQNWIGAMNTASYLGYSDWRLPTTGPVNGTAMQQTYSDNGTTDLGYNISAPGTAYAGSTASEMAYMFYNNLGNKGYYSPSCPADCSSFGPQPGWGLTNTGPFSNLQPGTSNLTPATYWSGTLNPGGTVAYAFDFKYGFQDTDSQTPYTYAWAVRPGDVNAVPLPAAFWLFGSGLIGLIGFVRRRSA